MNLLLCISLTVVLTAFLFTNAHSKSFSKREISDSGVDPTKFEVNIADVDREKRGYDHHHDFQVPEVDYKAQGVEHKYALKNALLGFVFHAVKRFSWHVSSTPKAPTTTEDIVIFEKDQPVSLDIPDRLFGSSFTLVTNLSSTVGDYIINSSMRLANALHTLQPKIGKGNNLVIEATENDKPVFKDNGK